MFRIYLLIGFLLPAFLFGQATQKPLIEASNGMVVSTHPAASQIGLDILKKGGNAIDAAVAVNFALAVCHPAAGNIGGGGFLVYRTAKGKVYTLDYREMAPLTASRDMYLDSTGQVISGKSFVGIHSVGVPGAVAGMEAMHKRLGKLAWEELVQPAVDLARNGVVLTGKEARGLNRNRTDFMKYNPGRAYMVKADSTLWAEGELFIQNDLANTLERILKNKSKGFYQGETADLFVKEME